MSTDETIEPAPQAPADPTVDPDTTSVIESSPDDDYPVRLLRTVIAAIIVFSSSMTIVSASLPTMADDLDTSESFLAWSVTGLFLVMAVGTPVLGRLGDVIGHRKVFIAGAVVLSIGTVLCGLAPNALGFVIARMIAGAGIAGTLPTGTALIMNAYSIAERPRAMGWFQMAMTGAPVIGLVVGGPLIEAFGWRTLFAVLAPISFVGVALAWRVIRPTPPVGDRTIDWWGAASLGVATLSFLLFLERGSSAGFGDPIAVGLLVLSAVGLRWFVWVERRVDDPMLKLGYLRRRNFAGPLIAQPLSQFAYMGSFLIAPLLLDERFGYSVNVIALILLCRPAVYSISSPVGGRLATRLGERSMIIAGSVLIVASMLVWIPGTMWESVPFIILALSLSGLAMGLASPSYSTVLAGSVDEGDLGVANGMGTTTMNIGMLTGIQSMFVILGDGRDPADFARTFAFGAVVAAFGMIGALTIRARSAGE